MDIGTGIAIAGIWVFPVVCAGSKNVDSIGFLIGIIVAISMTIYVS